ncbi:MAG TPA: AMP-binding protein [Candidatus Paceibacterota bacterium]|nr:AMP-binding protein [Verrucomicrobiota bacterium]HSA10068.1 AMP-binding protein [Candidatus Paceibacterota bacterium]
MHSANQETIKAPSHFNFTTDVIDCWAGQRPDAPALWCVNAATGAEQKFSFRELVVLSCRAAEVLRASGIRRGDRVLLMLPRIPQWWIAMLGLIRLGAVPVPATLLLTSRDVAYRLGSARIRAVITNQDGAAKVGGFEGVRLLVGAARAGWCDFDQGLRQAGAGFRGERTRSNDPGILYFTSATTGDPKMVVHTQASYGLGHRLTGELWLDLRPDDVHWNLSDLGWGKAAWSSFYGPWHMGACVFALDSPGKFDPVLALKTLAAFPITTWCAPPTALRLIVRQDLSAWRFPHLRHCVSAGEPLNPEVLDLWREATGLTIYEAYGQTETVVLIGNFRSLGHPVRPGSMGKPTPGFTIALLDEQLREVPAGREGEVAVRVKPDRPLALFSEYWLNPEGMAAQFKGDWYLTGDRATRDADGYFWFMGRTDDVIKSSGYRIGPFEVESALMEHPAVLEVAVIGKPDLLRGQIVKACVVLRPGIEASDELKTDLQTHCRKLVAAYKYPREVEFVRELPKTTSGKTRRVDLRQTKEEEREPSSA